jgi:predicted ferric reductase
MHPLLLITLYLAIGVSPLVLGVLQGWPPRSFWDELASGLAMIAFVILLLEFVLSGRFRLISGRMGMDVTMRFHQLVARAAVAFALVHPFLYSTPLLNLPLPWDVTSQFTLGLDIGSALSGILAWVLLPGFILISIFRDQLPYRYETWRAIHAIGAVVIVVAVLHHTLNAGRYSQDTVLAWFWLTLLLAAIASLVWTYIISPLGESGRPYEVTSVERIAERTWELAIRPVKGPALDFDAGQFAWLNIGHSSFSLNENPFSMSSAPAELPDIRFVIKEVGDMTRRLGDIETGTIAYIDGAHGNLTLRGRQGTGIALIAGGVGIAPLLSIARQLQADGDERPVILLYGNRIAEQIVYRDELEQLAERVGNQVVHVVSEPPPGWKGLSGRVDAAAIEKTFSFYGADQWLYFVCGPPAMLEAVEDALLSCGIRPVQIVSEQFYYD